MAQFVTHMWHQQNGDGTISLTFERLSSTALAIDYVGPHPVDPPGRMLKEDFDNWSWKLCAADGFHEHVTAIRQPGLPNVEEMQTDTPEPRELPGLQPSLAIANSTFCVRLRNASSVRTSDVVVELRYENDAPQPFAGSSIPSTEIEGSISFVVRVHGTIPSTQDELIFYFPPDALPMLRSLVASSSSDSYSIIVCHSGVEIARISGAIIGQFVETNFTDNVG